MTPPTPRAASHGRPIREPRPRRGDASTCDGSCGSCCSRPGLLLSVLVVVLVVLASFWPELFTSRDPLKGSPARNFRGPSGAHWFGTDELGRDVFSRVVHGAQLSLKATLIAVAVAFVVGSLLGLVAGFVGRWVDDVLMRFVDVLLSIPALFLSLALVTALGYGTVKVAVAVGVASVAGFARVTRAEVLRVRQAVFVEASRSCGARWYSVLVACAAQRHAAR